MLTCLIFNNFNRVGLPDILGPVRMWKFRVGLAYASFGMKGDEDIFSMIGCRPFLIAIGPLEIISGCTKALNKTSCYSKVSGIAYFTNLKFLKNPKFKTKMQLHSLILVIPHSLESVT